MNRVRGRRDDQKALELYRESAEKGDAHCQVQLGKMYLHGMGVVRDYKAALEWVERSAEQGNSEAQAYLGHMYEKGLGVDRDIQKALELFKKSAAQGNALGQIRLGDLYLNGSGVDQNPRKAIACYQKSAVQGNDPENAGLAHLRLGVMYCQGKGVEKDLKKGFEFFKKAAELGNAEAQLSLGTMYRDGVGVERDQKKALAWFQKSAGINKAPAYSAMGDIYRDGLVVEKNIPEAIKWYKKAAQDGDKYAKTELLKLQQEGSAPKKLITGSTPADKGNLPAMAEAADTQPLAMSVERKEEKAQNRFDKAVENGDGPGRGKLQQIQQPLSTRRKIEDTIPEGTNQRAARKQNRKIRNTIEKTEKTSNETKKIIKETKKARVAGTLLYLFSAIGIIGLSLIVIFFGFKKKADRAPASPIPPTLKIAALAWPGPQAFPTVIPELPPATPEKTDGRRSSPKPSVKSAPPVVEPAPAAVKIEPVMPLLRREYKSLDEREVSEMLKAKNIFDAEKNPGGNFQHKYETKDVAGLRLIFDRATNLVWTRQQNPVKMNLGKSIQWIESLNHAGYGGHGKWRLPTVEEAASLLTKNTDDGKTFLDAIFGGDIKVIWTGDSIQGSDSWVVDFKKGMVKYEKNKSRLTTLMVSSNPDSFNEQIPIPETPATDN